MDIKTIMKFGLDENKSKEIFDKLNDYMEKEIKKRVLEQDNKYKIELDKLKKINSVERELINFGARNIKAVLALIDIDFDKFDINNIRSEIENLKNNEETSFLFFEKDKQPKLKGIKPFDTNLYKDNCVKNMDYEELCKYYESI